MVLMAKMSLIAFGWDDYDYCEDFFKWAPLLYENLSVSQSVSHTCAFLCPPPCLKRLAPTCLKMFVPPTFG